jgi:CBS domain-containing protein
MRRALATQRVRGGVAMKVENLMTRSVRACTPSDSLEQAARIMWEADVGCLVVIDQAGVPIGMITDRDALMAAYTQGVSLRDTQVSSAMSRGVQKCSPETPLKEVEQVMQKSQIRRMPVVDANGKLIGIIALGDIARDIQSTRLHLTEVPGLAKTLACITQPRQRASAAAE